mmetsp:Transcript_40676/g.66015  ORF Transcript_40676/g.66015 Transcript_40676/m.66015 type:complete len:225 (+) Transcript_40676:486-1160(+)
MYLSSFPCGLLRVPQLCLCLFVVLLQLPKVLLVTRKLCHIVFAKSFLLFRLHVPDVPHLQRHHILSQPMLLLLQGLTLRHQFEIPPLQLARVGCDICLFFKALSHLSGYTAFRQPLVNELRLSDVCIMVLGFLRVDSVGEVVSARDKGLAEACQLLVRPVLHTHAVLLISRDLYVLAQGYIHIQHIRRRRRRGIGGVFALANLPRHFVRHWLQKWIAHLKAISV